MGKRSVLGLIALGAMVLLIVDSQLMIQSAAEGIRICLTTVIPSLFPLFVLSLFATNNLPGEQLRILRPIMRLCNIPEGGEHVLLLGLIGGYPVGAMTVSEAYERKMIVKGTAQRLLGFCNNAGPAFIFGIVGPLFTNASVCWILWGIHLLSAIITGILLPGRTYVPAIKYTSKPVGLATTLERSIRSLAVVCGWVVMFRILIKLFHDKIGWRLPELANTVIAGIMELSNGCIALKTEPKEAIAFILASGMLSFGGVCVFLQTVSVVNGLGTGLYIPGKIIQASLSVMLSCLVSPLLFSEFIGPTLLFVILLCCIFVLITALILLNREKAVAFLRKIMYSNDNYLNKETDHVVS